MISFISDQNMTTNVKVGTAEYATIAGRDVNIYQQVTNPSGPTEDLNELGKRYFVLVLLLHQSAGYFQSTNWITLKIENTRKLK